jgi:hypothetical protein
MSRSACIHPFATTAFLLLIVPTLINAEEEIPLQNWAAPPYWQSPAVVTATTDTAGQPHKRETLALPSSPLPFVAIAPCRQFDSRSSTPLLQNTPLNVTLIGAPCGIPAAAQAVSVNITVFNIFGALGNGVFKVDTVSPPASAWINYPPTETQRANAGVVALTGAGAIVVQVNQGAGSVDFVVDINGYYAATGVVTTLNTLTGDVALATGPDLTLTPSGQTLTLAANSSSNNEAYTLVLRSGSGGFSAGTITANLIGSVIGAASGNVLKIGDIMTGNLVLNPGNINLVTEPSTAASGSILKSGARFLHSGNGNTFLGLNAGNFTMTGERNTGSGIEALSKNTTGQDNTAIGVWALFSNTEGNGNTAIGRDSLRANTGGLGNIATGTGALSNNETGNYNTASGLYALEQNATGSLNIGIGYSAGSSLTTGDYNIDIGNPGVAGEANTIRIGGGGHYRAFLAGVRGVTTGAGDGTPIFVDSAGQLGTAGGTITTESVTGSLSGDVTGTLSSTVVSTVGGSTAALVHAAETASNAATSTNTPDTIVRRSSSGGFSAGMIVASLSGSVTGAASLNVLKVGDTMTGDLNLNPGNINLVTEPSTATSGNILKNGDPFIHDFGTENTFVGLNAGNFTLTGSSNTAIGYQALQHNAGGDANTAFGVNALRNNLDGTNNTATGVASMNSNLAGHNNTAYGYQALTSVTTGDNNIGIGSGGGSALTTGNNNIDFGNTGLPDDFNTIRIGSGSQTKTFIAAIRGTTTGIANAIPVLIDSNWQLGTVSSSIRFKEDVRDMAETSTRLMQLRPVTFRYKTHRGQSGATQFGLIAEEVEDVMPELVARSADGEVETVMYHELPAMLLNELQKDRRTIERQQAHIEDLKARLERLESALASREGRRPEKP